MVYVIRYRVTKSHKKDFHLEISSGFRMFVLLFHSMCVVIVKSIIDVVMYHNLHVAKSFIEHIKKIIEFN